MTFSHRPATFACDALMLGIAGPSSAGKTMSALRIATGLSPDKPIFFIDTERGRARLYARQFRFEYVEMDQPYSPARYLEAVKYCVSEGAGCVVVDSMSHEHEGIGGVLEMQEEELNRMAGDNYGRREAMKFTAWIKPKAEHNRMVNGIIQQRAHMIFCFRAKDKLELVPVEKNGRRTIEPVKAGWTPICTDRFEYEMTAMLILPPGSKGRPAFSERATKLNDELAQIFHDGEQSSEEHGRKLREWAAQEQAERAATPTAAVAKKRTFKMWLDDFTTAIDGAETIEQINDLVAAKEPTHFAANGTAPQKDALNAVIEAAKTRVGLPPPLTEAEEDAATAPATADEPEVWEA